jgi:NAD(P)-dependent dehydrogenase (short-subunit alcohol dehydrogenase family)
LALDLASRKARLYLTDINLAELEITKAAGLKNGAESVEIRKSDVRELSEVKEAADEMQSLWGGADLVINNAGVAAAGWFESIEAETWRWVIDTNLWGVIYGCQAFVPRMRKQGSGFVLNIASCAGIFNGPRMAPYNVSKAGVISLSETLRAELAGTGVSVSVACPFFFPTKILDNMRTTNPKEVEFGRKLTKKAGTTAEAIARACLDGTERRRFYILPGFQLQGFWNLKRLFPVQFMRLYRASR